MNFGNVVGGAKPANKRTASTTSTGATKKVEEKPVQQAPKKETTTMAKSDLEKWLDGVEDTAIEQLEEAKETAPKDFDDGTYVGLFTQHEYKMSKADNPGIATSIMFLESLNDESYIGESRFDWQGLDRDDAFKYFGWRLASMGVGENLEARDIIAEMRKNPGDLFHVVKDKLVVKFKLVTTKVKEGANKGREFQNISIIKVLEGYDLSGAPEPKKRGESSKHDSGGNSAVEEEEEPVVAKPGMSVKFKTEVTDIVRGKKIKSEIEGIGIIKTIDNEGGRISIMFEGDELEMAQADVIELVDEPAV
jgi:hypothetical protein